MVQGQPCCGFSLGKTMIYRPEVCYIDLTCEFPSLQDISHMSRKRNGPFHSNPIFEEWLFFTSRFGILTRGCRFVPSRLLETKPQMVPRDLNIGFQGLALIQGQIYNPVTVDLVAFLKNTTAKWRDWFFHWNHHKNMAAKGALFQTTLMFEFFQGNDRFSAQAITEYGFRGQWREAVSILSDPGFLHSFRVGFLSGVGYLPVWMMNNFFPRIFCSFSKAIH